MPRRALPGLLILGVVLVPSGATQADTVSYQVDAAHTGYVDAQLRPPLGRKWIRRDLGKGLTYPLIADGRVFIHSVESATLHALDPATGRTIWSRAAERGADMTYGHSRLFVTDASALTALDPANGAVLWTTPIYAARAAIVVGDNVVVDRLGGLSAYRWQDGLWLWSTDVPSGWSGLSSDGEKLYLAGGCGEAAAFHAGLGVQLWDHDGNCDGGEIAYTRVADGRLYVPDTSATWQALDTFDGHQLGTLGSIYTGPAIAAGHAYVALETELRATNLATGTLGWRTGTSEQEPFAGPPLVVGGVVYAQVGDEVVGFDRGTGKRLWRGERSIVPTETYPALAAGENRLIVPTADRLVAFGPGGNAKHVDDPDKTPASSYRVHIKAVKRHVLYGQAASLSIEIAGMYSRQVELQESRHPYRRWRTIRRISVGEFPQYFSVRPVINTRYRVIDRDTLPMKRSRARQVYLELYGSATYYVHGPNSLRVVSRFRVPPALRLHRRRVHVYRFRNKGQLLGRRVGSVPIRRRGRGRYTGRGVVRTPNLRASDRFGFCIANLPRRGYGRRSAYSPRCGKERG